MEPNKSQVKMRDRSGNNNEKISTGSSLDEFIKGFDTVHRSASFVGIQFKNANLELNVRLVGSLLFIVIIYALCFYTGWHLRGDWLKWLETLLIVVLNVQGTSKIWAGVVQQPRYFYLFQTTEQIYACFDADERNRPILRDVVTKMVLILKAMTVVYATAGGAIIVFVVLYAAVTRQHFIAISVFVPYVDHTSSVGYLITFMTHALMIVFCCNGYLASDTAFVATVVPIIGYANSLQNEIVNFNHLLTMPKRDEKLISEKLARIGKLHQMIVEFELDAIEHFQGGCLVQITTQAGAALICIFLCYICGYVQAFSVLVGLCVQITQYCALGTIVTAKNEQITADIYDIGWNLLQKPQQKMVVFMLHRAQVARDLTVGQMAPLNMVTYVKIMKTVYSFFAMLVTVMD